MKKKIVLDKGYHPNDFKLTPFGVVEVFKRKYNPFEVFIYVEKCIGNSYFLVKCSLKDVESWQNFYMSEYDFGDRIGVEKAYFSKIVSSKDLNKKLANNREDKDLVAVVEKYGDKCNLDDSILKVVEIPNVEYQIIEKYGSEQAVSIIFLG